jgi:subtilase family serine protease
VETAFHVRVQTKTAGTRTVLTTDRAPTLPSTLAQLGASVTVVGSHMTVFARRVSKQPLTPTPQNRYGPVGPYWFTDLKQAYGYPSYQVANGAGRTIAIVIPSDVLDSDLAAYFTHEALATPVIERRPVGGGAPFDPNSDASLEASVDVQQSLGSAPGAHLILYNIPDLTDSGILAGYVAAVEDNRADIVSSSFGGCEAGYTATYNNGIDASFIVRAYHDIFRQGNAQGITFVASSGDFGAFCPVGPTGPPFVKGISIPAADPAVTSVGGTNLITTANGTLQSSYVSENAFSDPIDPGANEYFGSSGGISIFFSRPFYQQLVPTGSTMRTNPDIAMHMGGCPAGTDLTLDPCTTSNDRSAAIVAFGGSFYGVVGTSLSAPEFAGLLAVTEQNIGSRLGNANVYIYGLASLFGQQVYRHNIPGENHGYATHAPYDYVIGVGTPHAAAFSVVPNAPLAGNPGTPSNP